MARSLWKGPVTSLDFPLNKKISRTSIVSPSFIGREVYISNGNKNYPVSLNLKMIGHKFGEFMPTRKFANHKKILKKFSSKK